jgi:hypothetical protein
MQELLCLYYSMKHLIGKLLVELWTTVLLTLGLNGLCTFEL